MIVTGKKDGLRFLCPVTDGSCGRISRRNGNQDRLFLPEEITGLSRLPVNPPTGGWERLQPRHARAVQVPGTVEEYLTTSDYPRPEDGVGVSWWVPHSEASG